MTKTPQEQNNGIARSLSIPNGSIVSRAVTAAAANIKRRSTCRDSKHYSVSVFYLMATEEDNEIEDELAKGNYCSFTIIWHDYNMHFKLAQKTLRKLKSDISKQSKNNFLLERDVRFLDSRIALLIQNRMALDEVRNDEIDKQIEFNRHLHMYLLLYSRMKSHLTLTRVV